MNDTVTIPKSEYLKLRLAQAKLDLLEAGGVNNWEWYGDAIHRPNDGDNYSKIEEQITAEIGATT